MHIIGVAYKALTDDILYIISTVAAVTAAATSQ